MTILPPEKLLERPDAQQLYGRVPVGELFDALVVHELTHAFLNQTAGENITVTAHEYLAYAMQVASFSKPTRAEFLAEFEIPDAHGLRLVNSFVLLISPTAFAAASYRHFQELDGPCGFIERFVESDPDLPFEFRMPPEGFEMGP